MSEYNVKKVNVIKLYQYVKKQNTDVKSKNNKDNVGKNI
jgi:hypothetical protein